MNELVIMHDKQAVTTSLRVAESFSKVAEITKKEIEKALKKMGAEFGSDTTIY